jgi:RNA polymerase sigma-70 factor (ECF subfamily)
MTQDGQIGSVLREQEVGVPALSPSFEDFFDAGHERLLGALFIVTGNRHDAEDLMQEAYVRVLERWDRVGSLEDPTGYLYRTAMNGFRMRVRRTVLATKRVAGGPTRADDFSEVELREDVRRALTHLTPRQRAALVLTELLGRSAEEAATYLGIKSSTVRVLATQGRAALRDSMEDLRE